MSDAAGREAQLRDLEQGLRGFDPLPSRLCPPRARLDVVHREPVIARLLRSPAPLVLVDAPAGCGKSILLTQWAETQALPLAWLQIDTADDDPVVFLTYLALALGQVIAVPPPALDLLQLRAPPIEEHVLPELATAVANAGPFLLVLDDAHLMDERSCWRFVEVLLDHLPEGAQLAIGTRRRPPLPLARLRASAALVEVGWTDLAMSRSEAKLLLRLHESTVDDAALDRLLELTEGWATGLYLAVLANAGRPAEDWLPHVRGDQREIAAYLAAEVLDALPERQQTFLTRTAILDRLSAGLCRAVTGMDDAHALLAQLARDNLFVVALDDRDESYRYHHLFRELLQAQLQRREPEAMPALHQLASAWCLDHGDVDVGIRHAISAGDAASVADLAALQCDRLLQRQQERRAARLLQSFTDEQIRSSASLTLTAGMLALFVPDRRLQVLAGAACTTILSDEPTPVGATTLRSWQLILRASLAPEGVTQMMRDATLAWELEGESTWKTYAGQMLAFACYQSGQHKRAERVLRSLLPRADESERESVLSMLSLIAADQGRWEEAAALYARALATKNEATQLAPLLAHVRLLGHRRDPGLAALVERADADLRATFPGTPWRFLVAHVVFAEACLEASDADAAARWMTQAEMDLRCYPDAGVLTGRAHAVRAALRERRLTDPITPAEQRVLELLPTHLNATQLAARLFVTRNTVKSHMRRLYAKLGVTTRMAAVEKAIELGLMQPPDRR